MQCLLLCSVVVVQSGAVLLLLCRAVEMRRIYLKQVEQLEREQDYRQTNTTNFCMQGSVASTSQLFLH